MVILIWTFGYILGGVPQIQKMPDQAGPMGIEDCQGIIHQNKDRMADWARGRLGQSFEFPVGVYGECEPVQRDARIPN